MTVRDGRLESAVEAAVEAREQVVEVANAWCFGGHRVVDLLIRVRGPVNQRYQTDQVMADGY